MSILIHGMKMPKDGCKSCGFDVYGSCLIRANLDKPYEVTHSCPLIELPPHGRLIDADDIENITVIMNENGSGFNRIIAPTIIPPEGGGAESG